MQILKRVRWSLTDIANCASASVCGVRAKETVTRPRTPVIAHGVGSVSSCCKTIAVLQPSSDSPSTTWWWSTDILVGQVACGCKEAMAETPHLSSFCTTSECACRGQQRRGNAIVVLRERRKRAPCCLVLDAAESDFLLRVLAGRSQRCVAIHPTANADMWLQLALMNFIVETRSPLVQ